MASQESNEAETANPEEEKETDVSACLKRIELRKNDGNAFFKRKEYHDAITRYDIAIEEYKILIKTDYDKSDVDNLKKMKTVLGSIYNNRAFAYFRLEMFGQVCCLGITRIYPSFHDVRGKHFYLSPIHIDSSPFPHPQSLHVCPPSVSPL